MRKILLAIAILVVGLSFVGCKTNEKNMSNAYNIAVAARNGDDIGLDSTIYTKIRHQMKHNEMTVDGRTVDVSSQWVKVTEGGGGIKENLRRYCVVLGQFKLEFNAKSMQERLVDGGYPQAFVVQTAEPYYFVVGASFDSAPEAVNFLEKAKADQSLKLKDPAPFILEPAQFRR